MDYNQGSSSSSNAPPPPPPFGGNSSGISSAARVEGAAATSSPGSGRRRGGGFAFTFTAGGGNVNAPGSGGESSASGAARNSHYHNAYQDPFYHHQNHPNPPHNDPYQQHGYHPDHYSIPQEHSSTMPPASNISNDDGPPTGPQFDIIEWYPKYMSCLQYFINISQHSYACQALAAFVNIKLPFQRLSCAHNPQGSPSFAPRPPPPGAAFRSPPGVYNASPGVPQVASHPHPTMSAYGYVSLHPFIRRLVATGFDYRAVLHGWFGDDWEAGIGPLHEQERRNYLFAAKSGGWRFVKHTYDQVHDESVPYVMPLRNKRDYGDFDIDADVEMAEEVWSKWLAMEDWMLGSREPGSGMPEVRHENGKGNGFEFGKGKKVKEERQGSTEESGNLDVF